MQQTREPVKKNSTVQKHLELAFVHMFNAPGPGAASRKHNLVLYRDCTTGYGLLEQLI